LSVDSTAVFVLSHTERIEGQKYMYLQAACLYTNRVGQRLIRVHTLQLPATTSLSNVFRYTEVDSVTITLLKEAAAGALSCRESFKEKLTNSCVDMLHAYRVNCASMTSSGQLILPESLKLLPLYIGAIRKMAAFRTGSDARLDEKVAYLIKMLALPIAQVAPLVYPLVYTIGPLSERAGFPTGVGDHVYMPSTVACTSDKLSPESVYLIDNGIALYLYICEKVTPDLLEEFLGVNSLAELASVLAQTEAALTTNIGRIVAIVQQIRRVKVRMPWQPLIVVPAGTPEEARCLSMLSEDRVGHEMPYVDFLCHIHKRVQNKLE